MQLKSIAEKYRAEITLHEAAKRYLDSVMNGHTALPRKAWKAERDKLKAELSRLDGEYVLLKDEVQKVERIRRGIYDVLREYGRTRPVMGQSMEL